MAKWILIGVSAILTAVSYYVWIHEYRKVWGQDLDMPEWFSINMGILTTTLPLMFIATLCAAIAIPTTVSFGAATKPWVKATAIVLACILLFLNGAYYFVWLIHKG